jgi:hypothetical protein
MYTNNLLSILFHSLIMSNLLNSVTLKSFIKICKVYELDQDSKDIQIEDPTLDLEVVRLEHHILEVTLVK